MSTGYSRSNARPGTTPAHTPAYADLRNRLEANRLSIADLDEVAADPYVRIEDSAAPRAVTLLTVAIVLRSFPELLSDTGQIQITSGGNRVGYAYVSLDWIRAVREGDITTDEYARRVLETWQSSDRRGDADD